MPVTSHKVGRYGVRSFGNDKGIGGGLRADMQLDNASGTKVGVVQLFDEGASIPADSISGNVVTLNAPVSELTNFVDLLRNEKPVTINHDSSRVVSYLRIGPEPVGEGE